MRAFRLGLAVMVLAGFAACSSDEPGGDPGAREDVISAIRAMAEPEPASIEIQLPEATAEDLVNLSVGIEPEVAEFVEGARLTVKNDFGPDPLEQIFSLRIDFEAGSIEARQLEDDLYLRADLAALAEAVGVTPRPFVRALRREPLFRPVVRPALRGDWIHVFGAGGLLAGSVGDGGGASTERVVEVFAPAIEDAAAVTADGSDDAGDKYEVEIKLARFAEALAEAAEGLIPRPPTSEDVDALGDAAVDLDVWVDDGAVSRVEADISQLIDLSRGEAAVERPPLVVRVDVDPFDAELPRPRAKAQIPAAAFFRFLAAARLG